MIEVTRYYWYIAGVRTYSLALSSDKRFRQELILLKVSIISSFVILIDRQQATIYRKIERFDTQIGLIIQTKDFVEIN